MQLRDSCSRLRYQTKAGAGKIPLATQDTLACKKALRMGYSEICFRTELGGGRERGEPAMVLVRFEYLRSECERKLLIGQFALTHHVK